MLEVRICSFAMVEFLLLSMWIKQAVTGSHTIRVLQFYMKSRLNGLLLRADWETSTGEDDIKLETADKSDLDNIETTGEDDDIWQELDTVTEDKPKKATKHAIKQEPVAIENEDVVSKPKKKRKRNANA